MLPALPLQTLDNRIRTLVDELSAGAVDFAGDLVTFLVTAAD